MQLTALAVGNCQQQQRIASSSDGTSLANLLNVTLHFWDEPSSMFVEATLAWQKQRWHSDKLAPLSWMSNRAPGVGKNVRAFVGLWCSYFALLGERSLLIG